MTNQTSDLDNQEFQRLHDAVLESINFFWESARVIVKLGTCEEPSRNVEILCDKVSGLSCPAKNPWGPSIYVNEVAGSNAADSGNFRLEIEMQSGDIIVIEAVEILFSTGDGSSDS